MTNNTRIAFGTKGEGMQDRVKYCWDCLMKYLSFQHLIRYLNIVKLVNS